MSRLSLALLFAFASMAQDPKYKIGRAAGAEDIAAKDITVLSDGRGLPPGSGTASQGREIYERRCQKCHGNQGQGGEEGPALAGGNGSLTGPKPVKTVGSYWPHATTLFDYTRRAMPFDRPGTLTDDQVYALTARMLFLNGLIGETDAMDAKTLAQVKMPNRDGFVRDNRPDTKGGKAVKAK